MRLESDLAGKLNDKVRISNCQFKRTGPTVYQDADFNDIVLRGWSRTDTTQWMVTRIDNTTVDVWVVHPQ